MIETDLPISPLLPEIVSALESRDELVIEAAPGAGKTTLVPLALIAAEWRRGRKILILEPRRVAARAAADRMAALLGESVGQQVGYQVRLDKKIGLGTIVEVVTEGILTRRLQEDPELNDVAAVIFDEFHERSIHSDFGLALCLQCKELFRDSSNPLKLIVMSATLNGAALAELLGDAPLLQSEGRSFPVGTSYADLQVPYSGAAMRSFIESLAETVVRALNESSGNALVFLPGQAEIRKLISSLAPRLDEKVLLLPLHGGLNLDQQRDAIAPLTESQKQNKIRKLVVSTDIAETSLTIDGVSLVIDSGLCRVPVFDARTGMTRLNTERISLASSTQREGRAGRLGPGRCYRMWTRDQHAQLTEHSKPEIHQSDLAPLVLQMLNWGVSDAAELRWLDLPKHSAVAQAKSLLSGIGALNDEGQLTPRGGQLAAMSLHPRLAHMLIEGAQRGELNRASLFAALLSERIPLANRGADLHTAMSILDGSLVCERAYIGWRERTQRLAKQYRGMCAGHTKVADKQGLKSADDLLAFLLAQAYPDRIARRRENNRCLYQLANGRSAKIAEADALAGKDWLAVCELGGREGYSEDIIYSAVALESGLLGTALVKCVRRENVVRWQGDNFVSEVQSRIGKIVLSRETNSNIDEQVLSKAWLELFRAEGLSSLPWTPALRQWQRRVLLLRDHLPKSEPTWPDVTDSALVENCENWLLPYLVGKRKKSELKTLDLAALLQGVLAWPQPKLLDELAPKRISVPSGSSIEINYESSPPALEVKLQEMFGATETPTIASGKVALMVHLLSPARRPLQITQDLAGFWQTSYHDVKKEMKGRYPKHPWPDEPWNTQATRFTKHRPKR